MSPYRYPHFTPELMWEDRALREHPGPGEPLPRFDMPTTSGIRAQSEDYAGRKLFVTFGSVT